MLNEVQHCMLSFSRGLTGLTHDGCSVSWVHGPQDGRLLLYGHHPHVGRSSGNLHRAAGTVRTCQPAHSGDEVSSMASSAPSSWRLSCYLRCPIQQLAPSASLPGHATGCPMHGRRIDWLLAHPSAGYRQLTCACCCSLTSRAGWWIFGHQLVSSGRLTCDCRCAMTSSAASPSSAPSPTWAKRALRMRSSSLAVAAALAGCIRRLSCS